MFAQESGGLGIGAGEEVGAADAAGAVAVWMRKRGVVHGAGLLDRGEDGRDRADQRRLTDAARPVGAVEVGVIGDGIF